MGADKTRTADANAMRTGERRNRRARGLGLLGFLVAGLFPVMANAQALIEPMTGDNAPGWVIGGAAYLTASAGVDPPGQGWLRLTTPLNDQSGYAYLENAFDISSGAIIQFDYATWGGTGADGYNVFLFDSAYGPGTFSIGASGGSLGYAQKTVAPINPGLSGGYLGIGVDEFGNFSNPTEGRIGGPGSAPNSVSVRGPYNHPGGAYSFLGGSGTLGQELSHNGLGYRPAQTGAQYRKVLMYLQPVAAPDYMRIDVYVQFGYGAGLTHVLSGLNVGRPVPTNVKIGYSASTGGQTNYHEIRNLTISSIPTDIDLAVTKVASAANVTRGGPVAYTVTARNYGPSLTTAVNVPITDVVPTEITGVSWTCAYSGPAGGSCGTSNGSGNNISTTATLPFGGAATYTISGTVSSATPLGTVLTNTASLSVPSGLVDFNPANNSSSASVTVTGPTVSVSGRVYNDANHDGVRGGAEGSPNIANIYAKLFRASDLSAPLSVVNVSQSAGTYSFSGVPSHGTYTVILSSNNAATYTPSFPNADWTSTAPVPYTLPGVAVGAGNVTNVDFGVYNGSRITGRVIKDDGANGSIETANDGVLNASESGLSGVTMQLRNSSGATTYDTTTTDAGGNFSLYTNVASATLRVYEVANPAGYASVNFNPGTTGGSYNIANDYLSFAYTRYTDYSGIVFSDVPVGSFTPTPQSSNGTAQEPVYFAHAFTPGSGGSVSFATTSRSQGGWPALVYYKDTNCSGTYDAGDTVLSGATTVEAEVAFCILVRDTIASSAANGATDVIVTRATFTFTNSVGPVTRTYDVTDTTTVVASNLSTSTKTWVDANGADQEPGDVVRYTITLTETAGVAASGVSVTDDIPANVTGFTVISVPAGATDASTSTGGANGAGYLNITGISVPASGSRTVVFDVAIAGGASAGTVISNTATVTNPAGQGATPTATDIVVSGSAVPGAGTKPLYLYGATSGAYPLSRNAPTGTPAYVSIGRGNSHSWTETPVLQSSVTLDPTATVPVHLWIGISRADTRNVTVTLDCTAGGLTPISQTRSLTLATSGAAFTFTLPAPGAGFTCAQGNAWILTISNASGGSNRSLQIYPVGTGYYSQVRLPSLDVINVDSIAVYSDVAYPGGVVLGASSVAPSMNVRVRATVSDPFGSFDITAASVTITDSLGAVKVNAAAMTEIFDSGAATKIYEYAYTVPAPGPTGDWTLRVDAKEGHEDLVTDYGLAAMPVRRPVLTLVKSVDKSTATPGATVRYTVVLTNTSDGVATSVVLSDKLHEYLSLKVGSFTFVDGSPSCGLALGTPSYNDGAAWGYTPTPDAEGFDDVIRAFQLPLPGTMNTGGANCSVTYDAKVR